MNFTPAIRNVIEMLTEDRNDFVSDVTESFHTQTELHTVSANLQATLYLISIIATSRVAYTPLAHKAISSLSERMSTGVLDKSSPILITTAASPKSLTKMLNKEIIKAIGANKLGIDSAEYVMQNIENYHIGAIAEMKSIRSRNRLITLAANLLSILDMIGHMASRKSSYKVSSINLIGNLAARISSINPYIDKCDTTDIKYVVSILSNDERNLLTDDPDTSIIQATSISELTSKHVFNTTLGTNVFNLMPDGSAKLDGKNYSRISNVRFSDGKSGVKFDFTRMSVILLNNGDLLISPQNSGRYFR